MCPKCYGFLVLNMNTTELFCIAFMFSTTYLRLEGKVPPLRNEKLGIHVKVTFWFRLMYLPSQENEIGLNMNAIEKNHFK